MTQGRIGSAASPAAMVTVATTLMAIGLVMVASTSASLDRALFAPPLLSSPFGRQLLFVALGFIAMLATRGLAPALLSTPARRRRLIQIVFFAVVVCLLITLVPGVADGSRGSFRWLRFSIGGVMLGLQPSECAKLAMVAYLASLLTHDGADPRALKATFLPAAIVLGITVLLVGTEDFGTSVLLAAVGAGMLVVAGSRLRHLAVLGAIGVCGLASLLIAAPYRVARLSAFLDFGADPSGSSYQPRQSLTTIASGGWFGVGLGSGIQKYGYLPESRTDFIFAVICEEAGVLGALLVITLYAMMVWLGLSAMQHARSRFERLCAFGVTATIGLQAAMNVAVVTVVAPTTGISLPLISAGGSGVVIFGILIGLLAAIAARGADATVQVDATDDFAEHAPRWRGTRGWATP